MQEASQEFVPRRKAFCNKCGGYGTVILGWGVPQEYIEKGETCRQVVVTCNKCGGSGDRE